MITLQADEQFLAEALEYDEPVDRVSFDFGLKRRDFVQLLGAGLLISICEFPTVAQQPNRRGGRGGGRPISVAARLHIAKDGTITVLTGKVECGQGARAELTQAAAEELRVPVQQISLVMADTDTVPNDGTTAGSRSTPSSLPAIRQAAATARDLLKELARREWDVPAAEIEARDGKVIHGASRRERNYGDLAALEGTSEAFKANVPADVTVTPVKDWKVLGSSISRPDARALVTGSHRYPSDVKRPEMLYGKVLRPPAYGAKLLEADLSGAKKMENVVAVQDGSFVGVAASNTFAAERAIEAVGASASWESSSHPSSNSLYDDLKKSARGGVPSNPFADDVLRCD